MKQETIARSAISGNAFIIVINLNDANLLKNGIAGNGIIVPMKWS